MGKHKDTQAGQTPSPEQPDSTLPEPSSPEWDTSEPPPVPRPATIPEGILNQIDYVIRHPDEIFESLRQDLDLWRLSRTFLLIVVFTSAVYGFVMGGTNWLQGRDVVWGYDLLRNPFTTDFLMMCVTAVKVPVLFLLTLLIVVPPIYVSSTFVGSRATFSQVVTLLLASLAITGTVLASMATVAFFFSLTTRSYSFIKVLHVLFFAYAGVVGLFYLIRGFKGVVRTRSYIGTRLLFIGWLVLYMFVGTQLAWVMRPFVGSPGKEFTLFRERSGNFYENVAASIGKMFTEDLE